MRALTIHYYVVDDYIGWIQRHAPAGTRGGFVVTGTETRPTVVLVHGAFHGPWVWDRVAALLTADGWKVQAPALPSVVEPTSAPRGMHADADAIRKALHAIPGPVVAVAHSYGGIPVTEAANGAANVSHVVYLAAFHVEVGESLTSAVGIPDWWIRDGETVRPRNPVDVFYADVDPDVAASAAAKIQASSFLAFSERRTVAACRHIPSTYVICERDRALPPAAQRDMAQRSDDSCILPTGHSPMSSTPRTVAALIAEVGLARGAGE